MLGLTCGNVYNTACSTLAVKIINRLIMVLIVAVVVVVIEVVVWR